MKEFAKFSKYKDGEVEIIITKRKTIPVIVGVLGQLKKEVSKFVHSMPAVI